MRNLKVYSEDAFAFHKQVVDRKNNTKTDPDYKSRLISYYNKVEQQFESYNKNYDQKSLELIKAGNLTVKEKEDILSLYSYKAKTIQALKIKLTTTETNRILSTCPNCTIGEVNSLDHILPKEMFAEFAVNPKNLIPSCTKCNSFKVNSWLEKGQRIFLNLFLDELPSQQYLFVTTRVTADNIETLFEVKNMQGVDAGLFTLIQNHYRRLYLCERFSENASEVITSLDNSIAPYVSKLPKASLIDSVKEKISRDRSAFGHNYWKSLLELSLIENDEYLKKLFPNR